MSWNYRVIRHRDPSQTTGEFLEIAEVYYDKDGKPNGYCAASVCGETLEELRAVRSMQFAALKHPILDVDDLDASPNVPARRAPETPEGEQA